jgi:rod shape-determining protein MreC
VKEKPGSVVRVATPMRSLAQRFAFLLLLGTAVGLLMIGRTDPKIFEETRMALIDTTAPVLDALSRPVATVSDAIDHVGELAHIRETNAALEAENARLLQWQHAARTLLAENDQLRTLLNYSGEEPTRSVAARVIGDSGGPFIRSLLVNAGAREGVRRGHAAITGAGLLGRVAATGEKSSRVLLISDLNSRIPVLVESSRARAVLAGDNSKQPRLTFVSANADVKIGSRIVTSGHGGMFPTGLPIGVVAGIGDAGIRIKTFASSDRLEFVRLVDYGLDGVIGAEDAPMTQGAGRNR